MRRPTAWLLFTVALSAMATLWLPLTVLQLIDGLLFIASPADVARDVALWWLMALMPAALFTALGCLSASASRAWRASPNRSNAIGWTVMLMPVLWLCLWQFLRTVWLWLRATATLSYIVTPAARTAVIVVLVLVVVWLVRRIGIHRMIESTIERLLSFRVFALGTFVVAMAANVIHPPVFLPPGSAPVKPMPASGATAASPDIIVISLDAMADADANACGTGPTPMPQLRRIAAVTTCFSHFYAASNFTTAGTSTMDSGTLPWSHFATQPDATMVRALRLSTAAHVLQGFGYRTHAITDNLLASPRHRGTYGGYDTSALTASTLFGNDFRDAMMVFPSTSLTQLTQSALSFINAFDVYLHGDRSPYDSRRTYDATLQLLAAEPPGHPEFVWAHSLPPHSPYLPPPNTKYTLLPRGELERWQDMLPDNADYGPSLQPLVDKHRLRYRESMMAADARLGQFVDQLQRAGRWDKAIVVITSDHGESFEKGYLGHAGAPLHEALIRIPMLVKLPGQHAGRIIDTPVSQADLAPTLLDLVHAPALPLAEGRSLAPALRGEPLPPMPVFAMSMEHQGRFRPITQGRYAVIDGARKLTLQLPSGHVTLFDLATDPSESHDLAASQPAVVARLEALVRARLALAEQRREALPRS